MSPEDETPVSVTDNPAEQDLLRTRIARFDG